MRKISHFPACFRPHLTTALLLFAVAAPLLPAPAIADDFPEDQREAVGRLFGAALMNEQGYARLGELCDRFGHRLSGSPALEAAIDWLAEEMREAGFENVHKEEVLVPAWVRGEESAQMVAPYDHRLTLLGLGGSVGTDGKALEAEVLVVDDFDQLELLGPEKVRGKIVLFDVPFMGYGPTVQYRVHGASRAAALGAVAVLIRSVGPMSFDTAHTGSLRYAEDSPQIPAAALTIEGASMLRRIAELGQTPVVRLRMDAETMAERISHNLVGEVRGREKPEEVVILAGHIDSWDVGQGAQDDGAGCMIALEAARLMIETGQRPARTVRVVLFTNEENGLKGGLRYAEIHAGELPQVVAAIESDSGNGPASGFRLHLEREELDDEGKEGARARLEGWASLLEPIQGNEISLGGSGADIGPMVRDGGVVGLGLNHDTSKYFEIHHTRADTFEKIIKADLDRNTAIMAGMAWLLAEAPHSLLLGLF